MATQAQPHTAGGRPGQPFVLTGRRVIMEARADASEEAEGVLNPASARGPDGALYLFPRLVAAGNYSRIGIARVVFDAGGEPQGVERLGIALEPSEAYEQNPLSGGGCEDPRVTYLERFQQWVMAYTAYSPLGPRIALAASEDLLHWRRLGLVQFERGRAFDFESADNKDALLFPTAVENPRTGRPAIGLIHRPFLMEPAAVLTSAVRPEPPGPVRHSRWRARRPSMWLSYCDDPQRIEDLVNFGSHHRLMSPRAWWERVKIGGGTPPVATPQGWLVIYHGVSGAYAPRPHIRYSAGAVVLDSHCPERIRYRTARPILRPCSAADRLGWLDVVFPTAADMRTDLNQPDRIDVYYGMADRRIGMATLRVPPILELSERPAAPSRRAGGAGKAFEAREGRG